MLKVTRVDDVAIQVLQPSWVLFPEDTGVQSEDWQCLRCWK